MLEASYCHDPSTEKKGNSNCQVQIRTNPKRPDGLPEGGRPRSVPGVPGHRGRGEVPGGARGAGPATGVVQGAGVQN